MNGAGRVGRAIACALLLGGCAGSEAGSTGPAQIEGRITMEGLPPHDGIVQWADGGARVEAAIDADDGHFEVQVPRSGAEYDLVFLEAGVEIASIRARAGERLDLDVPDDRPTAWATEKFELNANSYSGADAAAYADRWYNNPNLNFADFSDPTCPQCGGDCTNFASQAILAGLARTSDKAAVFRARLNYQDRASSTNDWWYSSAAANQRATPEWAGANGLLGYLNKQADHPNWSGLRVTRVQAGGGPQPSRYRLGDIIVLSSGGVGYHSMIVVNEGWFEWSTSVAYRNSSIAGSPARLHISALSANAHRSDWNVFRPTGFRD
jgi:hypothetical protein